MNTPSKQTEQQFRKQQPQPHGGRQTSEKGKSAGRHSGNRRPEKSSGRAATGEQEQMAGK